MVGLIGSAVVKFGRQNHRPLRKRIIAASVEPERLALLRPGDWQIGILGELDGCQAGRLAAFEDVARDVRGEISQPEHTGEVGPIELLAFGEQAVLAVAELDQLAVKQMSPGRPA